MKYLLSLLILFNAQFVFAQWGDSEIDESSPTRERIFTGGGFGLNFGTDLDFISISPLIGYKFTEAFAGGATLTYRYTNYKYVSPKVSTNDYGVAPFLRYKIYQNIFLHSEYEYLNYELPASNNNNFRRSFSSFLAGAGFFQPFGGGAGFYAMALYNFSYRNPSSLSDFQPYDSPLILRAGFTLGF